MIPEVEEMKYLFYCLAQHYIIIAPYKEHIF